MVEQARVEAIGSRRMAGVAKNLTAMLDDHFHRGKYDEIVIAPYTDDELETLTTVTEVNTVASDLAAANKAIANANLNGTDANELQRQWHEVWKAAEALQTALMQVTPHGRDYQTAPSGAYQEARVAHLDLVGMARAVILAANDVLHSRLHKLLAGAQYAIRATKVLTNMELKRVAHSVMEAGIAMESVSVRTADHLEGIAALREKRAPRFGQ